MQLSIGAAPVRRLLASFGRHVSARTGELPAFNQGAGTPVSRELSPLPELVSADVISGQGQGPADEQRVLLEPFRTRPRKVVR